MDWKTLAKREMQKPGDKKEALKRASKMYHEQKGTDRDDNREDNPNTNWGKVALVVAGAAAGLYLLSKYVPATQIGCPACAAKQRALY